MSVECKFVGGPMDRMVGDVSSLVQCQIFFEPRERRVFLYNRVDELVYEYEPTVSAYLAGKYDEAWLKLGKNPQSVERWTGKTHDVT